MEVKDVFVLWDGEKRLHIKSFGKKKRGFPNKQREPYKVSDNFPKKE